MSISYINDFKIYKYIKIILIMSKWLSPKKFPIPFFMPFIGFFRIRKEYYVWPLIRYPHDEVYSILRAEYDTTSEIDYPDTPDDYLDLEDANCKLLKWMALPNPPKIRSKKNEQMA